MFVRKDLTHEQRAVQSIHAAIEAARFGLIPSNIEHPHLVLLGVKNQLSLYNCVDKLDSLNIKYRYFKEPDIDNEITSVVTEPISGEIRNHFRKYNLLTQK